MQMYVNENCIVKKNSYIYIPNSFTNQKAI